MLVCVFIAFSLCRESPDLFFGDEPLISEVVLSQSSTRTTGWQHAWHDVVLGSHKVFLRVGYSMMC
jgi:hypothetical protein